MWDPQGRYLGQDAQAAGVGKQYQLAGTQLAGSFRDQFEPWRFAGADLSEEVEATLIRLPLRSEASTLSEVSRTLYAR